MIPETILKDFNLKPLTKLLYGKLCSLSKKDGYCWASNNYLANYFNVTSKTISSNIKLLKDKGYIEVDLNKKGSNNFKRKIFINYNMVETIFYNY